MAQNRIPRGSHGEIKIKQLPDGRWAARAQVRDVDGRIRSVRVTEKTKGAASRKIQRRLAERVDLNVSVVTPDTTLETLAERWLQHRTDHGKVKTKGLLAPQTLATYNAEIEHVIIPAIGQVQVARSTFPSSTGSSPTSSMDASTVSTQPEKAADPPASCASCSQALSASPSPTVPLRANPIRDASQSAREPKPDVEYLTVDQAHHLRIRVRRDTMRLHRRRMPNRDLEEFVDLLLGTGIREGEGLAIPPVDLSGLHPSDDARDRLPVLHVAERSSNPARASSTSSTDKTPRSPREDRRLILPDAVAEMLRERMRRQPPTSPESPIFATRKGNWLSPANMGTRLRVAIARAVEQGSPADKELDGTTLHTLRRTVGTLIAHQVSLDAAANNSATETPRSPTSTT